MMKKCNLPPKADYLDFGVLSYETYLLHTTKPKSSALDWVKSILVLVMPYNQKKQISLDGKDLPAKFSYGLDYHAIVTKELEQIKDHLMKDTTFRYEIKSDISYLEEKLCAYLAGLGNFGKNNLIIHPKFGSFLVIGTLLLDQEFDLYDVPLTIDPCGSCDKCIKACPTNALFEGFKRNKCVSFLSQTKSKEYDLYKGMRQVFYGCDICQEVCPHNQKEIMLHPDFLFTPDSYLTLEEVLDLSDLEFDQQYQHKNFAWIKRAKVLRNLLVLKVNKKEDIASEANMLLEEEDTPMFLKEQVKFMVKED